MEVEKLKKDLIDKQREMEASIKSKEEELRGHNPSEHREGQGAAKPAYFSPTFGKTNN